MIGADSPLVFPRYTSAPNMILGNSIVQNKGLNKFQEKDLLILISPQIHSMSRLCAMLEGIGKSLGLGIVIVAAMIFDLPNRLKGSIIITLQGQKVCIRYLYYQQEENYKEDVCYPTTRNVNYTTECSFSQHSSLHLPSGFRQLPPTLRVMY